MKKLGFSFAAVVAVSFGSMAYGQEHRLTFAHDGRARSIEEAILWHGGEAEVAKNNFKNLTLSDRNKVLEFLNSL